MKFYSWTSGFHIWTQLILWWIFVSIQSWTGAVLFTAIRETAERVQWHFHVIILQVFLCCAVFYLYITLFWMQMPYSVLQDALVTLRLLCSSTFHSWTNILIAWIMQSEYLSTLLPWKQQPHPPGVQPLCLWEAASQRKLTYCNRRVASPNQLMAQLLQNTLQPTSA